MTDWNDLLERHGDAAWRSACRLLGNEADAADCVQEAFVAAVGVARREEVKNWTGLLKRLVTVYGLRILRQRTREWGRRTVNPAQVPSTTSDAAGLAEHRELTDMLKQALSELPDREAQAVCLYHLEGCSYEQVARELKISPNHLGVLLHRARNRLREALDKPAAAPAPTRTNHGRA